MIKMAILDGKHVNNDIINPAKHKFIGMFRPPKALFGLHICSCGQTIDNFGAATTHYLAGHDDEPQYETIKNNDKTRIDDDKTQIDDNTKLCINCRFYNIWFENWSPMSMCEHEVAIDRDLIHGQSNVIGLPVEQVRYNERWCGKKGLWWKEKCQL